MAQADIQAKLEEARAAHHDLMLGRAVRVFVDQNGERVEYTVAKASSLLAYIQSLESALVSTPARRGPLYITF